jgi:hypothetical protein
LFVPNFTLKYKKSFFGFPNEFFAQVRMPDVYQVEQQYKYDEGAFVGTTGTTVLTHEKWWCAATAVFTALLR